MVSALVLGNMPPIVEIAGGKSIPQPIAKGLTSYAHQWARYLKRETTQRRAKPLVADKGSDTL